MSTAVQTNLDRFKTWVHSRDLNKNEQIIIRALHPYFLTRHGRTVNARYQLPTWMAQLLAGERGVELPAEVRQFLRGTYQVVGLTVEQRWVSPRQLPPEWRPVMSQLTGIIFEARGDTNNRRYTLHPNMAHLFTQAVRNGGRGF